MKNTNSGKESQRRYRNPDWLPGAVRQAVQKKYYDNADMVQLFNVSTRTLQRWRAEGILNAKKIGGKIYYLADEVHAMMNAQNDLD